MPSLSEILLPSSTSIDRYMLRQLVAALIATTGGLAALIWLTQSLHFINLVVDRGLSLFAFLWLTGLLVPSFVAVILPITTYIVVQFIYARLESDRELTVLRAAGLSPFALARPAFTLALGSILACTLLNLWILPASYGAFREKQFEIRNSLAAFLLQEGVFTQVSPKLTVYVRARDPDGTLHGIVVDDARDKNSHATILAARGRLVRFGNTPRVLLQDGSRQEIDKQTGRLDVLTFSENTIDLTPASKPEEQRDRDISELTVGELLYPPPATSPRDVGRMAVEANKRLSGPLTAGSFALVALVSVLTGSFRRYGGLLRPLASVAIIVALLALQLTIGNLAVHDLALVPLIWLEATAPAVVCLWLLFGEDIRRGFGASEAPRPDGRPWPA